jgi:hypothetical protein
MHPNDEIIRVFLAAALRNEPEPWPANWNHADAIYAVESAAIYHGIAGLLVERASALGDWPAELVGRLRDQARAQAMWELRHHQLLARLLAAWHAAGIRALVMKGTALAYDLYANPAARSRADTDLLVPSGEAARAKEILAEQGYAKGVLGGVNEKFALQEPWSLVLADGGSHSIDLHWQVMNAPSLKDLLTFAECYAEARPLPRVSPQALTMDRVRLLIHTCLHRVMHCNTPYVVAGRAFHDSGRLIWSHDIRLLAEALDVDQWRQLTELAAQGGVSRACLEGLQAANASLGVAIPSHVLGSLAQSSAGDRNSLYFVRSRSLGRAWQDIWAFPGLRPKLRYALSRIVPDPRFVRAKYPNMANSSLPLLYARRLLALIRAPRDRELRLPEP